jgi:diguanylate cyclase (GGDEF)-like protein
MRRFRLRAALPRRLRSIATDRAYVASSARSRTAAHDRRHRGWRAEASCALWWGRTPGDEGAVTAGQEAAENAILTRSVSRVAGVAVAVTEEFDVPSVELRASSEELQATNEELQATNEELGTLNRVLGERGDALQDLNVDLENIQASMSQGMVIVNRELAVTRFTPMAVRVFALMDVHIGRPLLDAPTTLDIPGLEAALHSVVAGGPRQSIEAGDNKTAYLVQVLPYRAPDGRRLGAIVTLTDVSEMAALRTTAEAAFAELHEKSELLTRQATYDAVTGLINRGYFSDRLATEIARSSRTGGKVALAWIDLDHFKEINDELGHQAGDATLRVIGERVTKSVRGSDVIGRLGGDEIGVIVAGYGSTVELDVILERIVVAVREPFECDGHDVVVTASVGIALYPLDATTPKDLMRAADAAMYAAKRQGGDDFGYFDESMNEASGERRAKRLEITEAIARHEFELHYQPIVDAESGEPWGVEALVRWRRDGGLVPAADFIPFCEESGIIRALGLVTIRLLRHDLPIIRSSCGADFRVSFNMSVTQLEDRHVGEMIEESSGKTDLNGIVVEILESVFLPDRSKALAVLEALAARGAEISIDDYGSGYSNVRLLEALDPAYIKLDRSFLGEHHSRDSRAALIRSAVQIAHVVGATVIAEGVESADHRHLVREAGVDLVQGFVIARPMPLAELLLWLRDRPAASAG